MNEPGHNEIWTIIPGYPKYRISTIGRVKGRDGIRKTHQDFFGHERVKLCRDGKYRWHSISRLVLEAFRGPAPEGMRAAHLNGDPEDNRVSNLAWKTVSEITRMGYDNKRARQEVRGGSVLRQGALDGRAAGEHSAAALRRDGDDGRLQEPWAA